MLNINSLMKKRKDEDGVALIIAIVIIVVVGAIMTSLVMTSVTSAHKAIQNREWILNTQAAESAVQNALAFANSPASICDAPDNISGDDDGEGGDGGTGEDGDPGLSGDESNPNCLAYYATSDPYHWKTGRDGNVNWKWRLESVTANNKDVYDLYALAYNSQKDVQGQDTRAVKVRLDYTKANGYKIDAKTNAVSYIPTQGNLFGWAAFGHSDVEMYPGSSIDNTENKAGINKIGTNGFFNFPSGGTSAMGISTLDLMNSKINTAPNRCRVNQNPSTASEICATGSKEISASDEGIDLSGIYQDIKKTCEKEDNGGVWKASENKDEDDGISYLTAGCYDSIIIDNNTRVLDNDGGTPSPDDPAKVYTTNQVKGYQQLPGTSIKSDDSDDNNATTFQLYVTGQEVKFDNLTTTTVTPSKNIEFVGLIGGATAKCYSPDKSQFPGVTKYAQAVNITGSIACKEVSLGGNTKVYWDTAIADMQSDAKFTVWNLSDYQSITKDIALGSEANLGDDNDGGESGDGGDDSGDDPIDSDDPGDAGTNP